MSQKYFEIGKIVNTHGIRGELKVIPLTDDITRFNELEWFYIDIKGVLSKFEIEYVKYHKQNVLVKLKNINSIEDALNLKNSFVKIPGELAIKLPEGSFFFSDIIGCTVFDENNEELGIVSEILETGSNDVYIVKRKSKKDLLIPALKTVVLDIDIEDKKILVKIPEGLLDED